jgi:hypothetical protein
VSIGPGLTAHFIISVGNHLVILPNKLQYYREIYRGGRSANEFR